MRDRVHYSTDLSNRLLVKEAGNIYALSGEFKIEKNTLVFDPQRKSPLAEQLRLPKRIKFEGRWQLDENHDLQLVLIENESQYDGDKLKIHGKVISASANEMTFQVHCKKGASQDVITLLRLGGRWQADELNRLQFLVSKDRDEDILRFKGQWQLDPKQKIVYKYYKQQLKRKIKVEEELILNGYWQINTKNRLAYILGLKNWSFFEFRVQLESPVILGKAGEIRYRIAIGTKELKSRRLLCLSGKWKIGRRHDIYFECEYGADVMHKVVFGARVSVDKSRNFLFELTNKEGQDLGIAVTFTRSFLRKDALVFARLAQIEKDLRFELGASIKW
ncbi:MAG: hypothetical protein JW869_08135 [Candidatus Omnitrophica bacterium]|nr:hypothetical protein [Candidatus Omnitrophota bacterium]